MDLLIGLAHACHLPQRTDCSALAPSPMPTNGQCLALSCKLLFKDRNELSWPINTSSSKGIAYLCHPHPRQPTRRISRGDHRLKYTIHRPGHFRWTGANFPLNRRRSNLFVALPGHYPVLSSVAESRGPKCPTVVHTCLSS